MATKRTGRGGAKRPRTARGGDRTERVAISWLPLHGVLDFYIDTYIPAVLEATTSERSREYLMGILEQMKMLRFDSRCKLHMVRYL